LLNNLNTQQIKSYKTSGSLKPIINTIFDSTKNNNCENISKPKLPPLPIKPLENKPDNRFPNKEK
jgi:hypothetical protein